MFIKGNITGL